jgi:signal transduction histidine kinase
MDPARDAPGTPLAGPLDVRTRAIFERSLRARLLEADERWGGSGRAWIALVLAVVFGTIAVLLWTSGLARSRAVAAEVFLLGYAGCLLALVRPPRSLRGRLAVRSLLQDLHSAFLIGAVACTGGLHSPLLVVLVTVTPARVLSDGRSRRARLHVLVVCGVAVVMALAPGAWFGAPLSSRSFAAVAALGLAAGALFLAHHVGFLASTLEEAVWDTLDARERFAAQALARSRELEQFGARLSHELKNPLAAIKALAQLWSRAAGDPEEREQLGTIVSEAERMRHVLDDYLSFSRPLEKLRLQPVSLGELAREVLAVLAGRADEARVALHAAGDAEAAADPRRLKEALLNLVANGLEATPPGGRVDVIVSAAGGVARIAVTDTGAGMAREVLERIGTAFFTTREAGTGLGVLLARAVFTQHGGSLRYQSAPGVGTTAVATLPASQPERSDARVEAAARR